MTRSAGVVQINEVDSPWDNTVVNVTVMDRGFELQIGSRHNVERLPLGMLQGKSQSVRQKEQKFAGRH